MGESKTMSLQSGYLVCANNLRREAKLCDIILYVQGRMGAMVGYPAHKLLLISASKYFKLLFEREDLRNYCHFPHLSEEGMFAVLDIIYGRDIRKETDVDDALMVARFLQADCAIDELERRKEKAHASPSPEPCEDAPDDTIRMAPAPQSFKRKMVARQRGLHLMKSRSSHQLRTSGRRIKNRRDSDLSESDHSVTNVQSFPNLNLNSAFTQPENNVPSRPANQELPDQSAVDDVSIKLEPDLDLALGDPATPSADPAELPQLSLGQGGPLFPGQLDQTFMPITTTPTNLTPSDNDFPPITEPDAGFPDDEATNQTLSTPEQSADVTPEMSRTNSNQSSGAYSQHF